MASPSAFSDHIASGILVALHLAIFERRSDGLFRVLGPLPAWFEDLMPDGADAAAMDLADTFLFLGTFFSECGAAPPGSHSIQSDIWTERDRRGEDRHLQALAMTVDGRFLLILESPAGAYHERSLALQRAHDTALQNERIERLSRELARLNEELKARNLEVERATRAKSEFLAAMSHEIRTPMNAIIGMADLLYQTSLTPDQRKYVEVFQRAGENLLNLINDILDLSKVESGKVELESVDFDLAGVVSKATEIIQVRAMTKGLTVRYKIAPGVPTGLIGDPGRLQQVLLNLLGNSMKFTEQGGLEIAVELDPESNQPGHLRFAVSDTGIGIPADKLDLIFENFTQADSSTTRKYGGTGLGLSISRQFVALMHGRIWVTSEVGVGSTFYFTAAFGLQANPFLTRTPQGAQIAGAPLAPLAATPEIAHDLHILLADDSEDNRFLIQSYLKGTGCSIDIAENGRVAVDKFRPGVYDLILMDVEMPEMDGYTATRLIRQHEQATGACATPILALTAHAFQQAVNRSLEAGFTEHLTKPIRRSTLLDALSKYQPAPRPAAARAPRIHVTVDASLLDLVPNYLDKRRQDLPKFTEALAAEDYATIRRLGHNLKGTGAGYGFPVLTEIGAAIEDGAQANNGSVIRAKVEELARYLTEVEWSASGDLTEA
jgi:signal transduction histidine kinase/FixJ family two-component response regulator/HPt (histidine-containing phosphotransfer) domain-containing protein